MVQPNSYQEKYENVNSTETRHTINHVSSIHWCTKQTSLAAVLLRNNNNRNRHIHMDFDVVPMSPSSSHKSNKKLHEKNISAKTLDVISFYAVRLKRIFCLNTFRLVCVYVYFIVNFTAVVSVDWHSFLPRWMAICSWHYDKNHSHQSRSEWVSDSVRVNGAAVWLCVRVSTYVKCTKTLITNAPQKLTTLHTLRLKHSLIFRFYEIELFKWNYVWCGPRRWRRRRHFVRVAFLSLSISSVVICYLNCITWNFRLHQEKSKFVNQSIVLFLVLYDD